MTDLTAGPGGGSELEQPSSRAHMDITTKAVVYPGPAPVAAARGGFSQLGALVRGILTLLRPARKR